MPSLNNTQITHDPARAMDVIEHIAEVNEWQFDRRGDAELAVQAPGKWCDFSLYFAWNETFEAMHFSCAFDVRVPRERRAAVYELLALINEKLWLGHFGMWDEESMPMFRHVLPLRGLGGPAPEQVEDILDAAIIECERFFPAFQYAVWGGRAPADALEAAMVDTVGEA
ncbi:MAG: type III secretion system chaperone family protein [Rhodospirillales bacterium]